MTMQQSLIILARIADRAAAQGYIKTHEQLSNLHEQLSSLDTNNHTTLMVDLLNRVESQLERSLNEENELAKSDDELAEECQESAKALFHSYNLTQALNKELQSLAQLNQRAQTNQRYYDQKKNEAIRRFKAQVDIMRAKATLNAAEIAEFNRILQDLLEKDFAVKNLPKAPMPQQMQADAANPSAKVKPILDAFSHVASAANSGNEDEMKNAAGGIVGLLLDMIIESIATVCKTFAPSIAPFISQVAQFAKNAFSQWFSSTTGIAMKAPSMPEAEKQADMPFMPKAAAMPSATFAAPASSKVPAPLAQMGGNMLHAAQRFLQRNMHQSRQPAPSAKKPTSRPAAAPTKPMTEIPASFVRPRNGNTIPKPYNP